MSRLNEKQRGPSYLAHWCVLVVFAAAVAGGIIINRQLTVHPAPGMPIPGELRQGADWFLLVRCPELASEADGAEAGRTKLKEWIAVLQAEGFHPVTFTEAVRRLRSGKCLPERAVVLAFDPSYRNTINQVLPVLESLQVPALWITRPPGTIRSDRRFVSAHTRRSLSAQPLWDVALQVDEHSFALEKTSVESDEPRVFGWQTELGVTGVNGVADFASLYRLHANARWSAHEFVDRLKADVPLRHLSQLSVRQIKDRWWGVLIPPGGEAGFDLKAPLDRRFCSVSWEGTRGVNDIELDLTIGSWFGEAWVLLRSDYERGDKIRVGFVEGNVRVLQEVGGVVVAEYEEPWDIKPREGFRVVLALQDGSLRISGSAAAGPIDVPVQISGSGSSRTELLFYDRIHGVAAAQAVRITASPLPCQTPPERFKQGTTVNALAGGDPVSPNIQ